MKKNDLIKLLQEVDGNPDVVIWNGLVGDWMHIDKELVELKLVKHEKSIVRRLIDGESIRDNEPLMTDEEFEKWYKTSPYAEWEMPNQFIRPEDFERWYGKRRKRLLIINAESRGKSMHDRIGKIEY